MNPILRLIAFPFSFLYGLAIWFRNLLFSLGILPSKSYQFPIICIGNLSVGGTGKTPHTEYLIRLLQNNYRIATLSRGYGRATKGYRLAADEDTARSIGDEPFQLFTKYPKVQVAVSENRNKGIQQLLGLEQSPEVIIMDDAFQHRYVKADLNILLTEYDKPYIHDYLLPAGSLRESRKGALRADIIIVTKCPSKLTPLEMRSFTMDLNLQDYQKVYYSYIEYDTLQIQNMAARELKMDYSKLKQVDICLLTAIAKPEALEKFIREKNSQAEVMNYPDHYFFRNKDYELIRKKFINLTKPKILICTEKDASKLNWSLLEDIPVFVIPIRVKFHPSTEEVLDEKIIRYVKTYQRGS